MPENVLTHLDLFSGISEDSPSQPSGRASKRSASRKSIHGVARSSRSTGRKSRISETCEQSQLFDAISLPGVSHASRTLLPGSEEARKTTVTSGRQCATLLDDAGPLGCLVKTCMESSAWNSTRCFLTWRASAIGSNRLLFQLVPSMPRTEGTEFGLLPTLRSHESGDYQTDRTGARILTLTGVVKNPHPWPTPSARDWKSSASNQHGKNARPLNEAARLGQPSGQLNPTWVEWLMGYPEGWTDLRDSEIPSSRKSPSKSSPQSPKS